VANELEPFSFSKFEKDFIKDNKLFRPRKSIDLPESLQHKDFDYSPIFKRFKIFNDDHSKSGTVSRSFFSYVRNKLREGRIGAAVCMHCSYQSLMKFRGNVSFNEITVAYLNQYEQWLQNRDVSKTTIGIYIRALRTIFNEAIEEGIIKREKCYPFGRRRYRIPASKNIKKALDLSDVSKIYYYECKSGIEGEQKAKDFWLFSYFGNRMNTKDIAYLKWKNLREDYLVFERVKKSELCALMPTLLLYL
jgi:integrase/recombinase XerD